jgi:hypothetical protein
MPPTLNPELIGYSEDSEGNVVLRMSRLDYEAILLAIGIATGFALKEGNLERIQKAFALLNRVNQGNPHFTAYEVGKSMSR